MPYLFLSSLFLSQVAEALATRMFYFSGNTRARIPITRPLLGTRSLPGQLAESRLMCWAADSRLPGRVPAARVRGHWLVLRNFSLDCCWGPRLALRTAAEVGRRVYITAAWAWTATPRGLRGEQLAGRTSAGHEEPRQRPLLRLPPPLCIKCVRNRGPLVGSALCDPREASFSLQRRFLKEGTPWGKQESFSPFSWIQMITSIRHLAHCWQVLILDRFPLPSELSILPKGKDGLCPLL